MRTLGLVHIYTGKGKGKTTAALGLGLRAAGCGCRVCFFQFFKRGPFACGEQDAVKKLGAGFRFRRFNISHPFFAKTGPPVSRSGIDRTVSEVCRAIKSGRYDLIVLDEILNGLSGGLIKEAAILKIIREKPAGLELVLTGRGLTKKLISAADYVTSMDCVKHPFEKGVCARKGIEF